MGKYTLFILVSVVMSLTACQTFELESHTERANNKALVIDNNQIVNAENQQVIYTAGNEIEAITFDDDLIVWNEDNDNSLKFSSFNDLVKNKPVRSQSIFHDIDVLCMAPLNDDIYDLYAHDGDEFFFHYWLQKESSEITLIRKIPTNPEIQSCYLTDRHLVFFDPFLGKLSIDREIEKDIVLKPHKSHFKKDSRELNASVTASVETDPVNDRGDAADDPAIIVTDQQTWILGTNKKRGLAVYNIRGEKIHFINRGRLNNVDVVRITDDEFLVAASNRTEKTIDLFWAKPNHNELHFIDKIPLSLADPYGLCMNKNPQGVQIVVGDSDSKLDYWLIRSDSFLEGFAKKAQLMQQFEFSSQTEGCVIDSETNALYVGEENKGIWRIDLNNYQKDLIEPVGASLVADVEGMDIYQSESNKFLVVSSQGSDSYVVYQLEPWTELTTFNIKPNFELNIDGVSETDGLAVSNAALPGFPEGILVVQDGRNLAPKQNQNFKIIDWRDVSVLINKK